MHLQRGETPPSSKSGGDFGLSSLLPLAFPATWVAQCRRLDFNRAGLISVSFPSVSLWEDRIISSSEGASSEGT